MRDIMKLLQQAQEMQGQYQKIQEELQQMTLTGTAGGGMVSAEVNGQGILKRVKIDASVVNPADTEMLEDLITVAIAKAEEQTAYLTTYGEVRSGDRVVATIAEPFTTTDAVTAATGTRATALKLHLPPGSYEAALAVVDTRTNQPQIGRAHV